jgi:hypothetical protein
MFPRPMRPSWGLVTGSIHNEEYEGYGGRQEYLLYIPANLSLSYSDPTIFLVGTNGPYDQLSLISIIHAHLGDQAPHSSQQ